MMPILQGACPVALINLVSFACREVGSRLTILGVLPYAAGIHARGQALRT